MPSLKILLTSLLLLSLSTTPCLATTQFKGRVIRVADGDSITVQVNKTERYKVRLGAIDAPERRQPYGNASRKSLASVVAGETVLVNFYKIDKYGRFIAQVSKDGRDVGLVQIKRGMAWHFKHFASEQSAGKRTAYSKAQAQARESGAGLWSEANPEPPWEYRRKSRKR